MASMSTNPSDDLVLTRHQVRQCDAIAIERFGIDGLVLMENAGAAAARIIHSRLINPAKAKVLILAGTGNNGGDGFVVARHLANVSVSVSVIICGLRDRIKGDALANLQIVEKMNFPVICLDQIDTKKVVSTIQSFAQDPDIIVDALLGTGTVGPPRQPIRSVIETINQLAKPVIALDIPSGLDCDTGQPLELAIKAGHTITFAAMKKGFLAPAAKLFTGDITVASIGVRTDLLMD